MKISCKINYLCVAFVTTSSPCGTEESPSLPPRCITAEGVWEKVPTQKRKSHGISLQGSPQCCRHWISIICLFFLDVGQILQPSEIVFSSTW